MSQQIEKWKRTLQDRASTQKRKQSAVQGLIGSGIHPQIVKAWLLQGAPPGEVDRDTKIRRLKWVIGKQSGTTGDQKRRAVQELLEFGICSEVITSWAKS
jgi:hypothetical protein